MEASVFCSKFLRRLIFCKGQIYWVANHDLIRLQTTSHLSQHSRSKFSSKEKYLILILTTQDCKSYAHEHDQCAYDPEKPPLRSVMMNYRKNHSHYHLLTPAKSEHQVQRAFLLNIIVR